jgi:pSer/pThr/pTyr-binding forkhead associated (FHA) protein
VEPARPSRRKTQIRTEFPAPEPGRPCAFLIAEEGILTGRQTPIENATFWIGSEEANSLCIGEDRHLSGYHACIEFRDGTLLLHDNNSTNGTYLNGERVAEIPRSIAPGDRIKVGHSVFVIMRA